MLHAKNSSVAIDGTNMDYISFGCGEQPLVILPGLSDGLKTVKGTALPLAAMYRLFAKDFKVYVFSRKNDLTQGYTIRDMARDQAKVMDTLELTSACVMGVSQGGMVALHLAADRPDLVQKLVLANTAAYANGAVQSVLNEWVKLAREDDFRALFADTAEKTYTEQRLKLYRPLYSLLSAASKPKSMERFLIQANAILDYDARPELSRITCPTLILGGGCDKIVGPDAAQELANDIPGSRLHIYDTLGHGAYEEARDFNQRVMEFYKEQGSTYEK